MFGIGDAVSGVANLAGSAYQAYMQDKINKRNQEFTEKQNRENRAWQEQMSNTAHRREIADMKAAGLNPILSATGGSGAAVGSGGNATTSISNPIDGSMFSKSIATALQMKQAQANIDLTKAQTARALGLNKLVDPQIANVNSSTSLNKANKDLSNANVGLVEANTALSKAKEKQSWYDGPSSLTGTILHHLFDSSGWYKSSFVPGLWDWFHRK